jgi:hypothetical protein
VTFFLPGTKDVIATANVLNSIASTYKLAIKKASDSLAKSQLEWDSYEDPTFASYVTSTATVTVSKISASIPLPPMERSKS